jgi:hypothetical protein
MIIIYIGNVVYIPLCSWCCTSYLFANHSCYYCDTPPQLSPSRTRMYWLSYIHTHGGCIAELYYYICCPIGDVIIRTSAGGGIIMTLLHFVPVKVITMLVATRVPDMIATLYRVLAPYHIVHSYGYIIAVYTYIAYAIVLTLMIIIIIGYSLQR